MLLLGEYSNMSESEVKQDIVDSYQADSNLVNKFDILVAYYNIEGYEGNSFFLFINKETKELFENHACHCSCYGFEGQFEPKATTMTYLKSKHFYATGCTDEVQKFIETL